MSPRAGESLYGARDSLGIKDETGETATHRADHDRQVVAC